MSTLMTRIEEVKDWLNPNVVKVVADQKGFALYFSRSPIPFPRDLNIERLLSARSGREEDSPSRGFLNTSGSTFIVGNFLLRYSKMKPTPLEKLEKLEQLRVLENGYRIKITPVDYEPFQWIPPKICERSSPSCPRSS